MSQGDVVDAGNHKDLVRYQADGVPSLLTITSTWRLPPTGSNRMQLDHACVVASLAAVQRVLDETRSGGQCPSQWLNVMCQREKGHPGSHLGPEGEHTWVAGDGDYEDTDTL